MYTALFESQPRVACYPWLNLCSIQCLLLLQCFFFFLTFLFCLDDLQVSVLTLKCKGSLLWALSVTCWLPSSAKVLIVCEASWGQSAQEASIVRLNISSEHCAGTHGRAPWSMQEQAEVSALSTFLLPSETELLAPGELPLYRDNVEPHRSRRNY